MLLGCRPLLVRAENESKHQQSCVCVYIPVTCSSSSSRSSLVIALLPLPNSNNNGLFGNVVGRALVPVSYTHLRAHETPEHLVCRLLLEKKKKKKLNLI